MRPTRKTSNARGFQPPTLRTIMVVSLAFGVLLLWKRSGCNCPDCSKFQQVVSFVPSTKQQELMIGTGATVCGSAQVKQWFDPNHGKVYAGVTTRPPKDVSVSVHNEEYDKVRYSLFSSGRYYEEELRSWFQEVLEKSPKNGWVMDVGANIGYFTLVAAGFGQNVLSFEPNPANVLRCCQSLQLNGWSDNGRVSIFRNGVTDKSNGEMVLEWPEGKPGEAKLRQKKRGETFAEGDNKAMTPLVALDSFAESRGWFEKSNDVSVIILKIDVESHEIEVLDGAKRLLSSGIVKNVYVEFWKSTGPKIVDRMIDFGFMPNNKNMPSNKDKEAVTEALLKAMQENKQPPFNVWWKRV